MAFHDRKTIRLKSHDYNTVGAYFLTICTRDRRCILSHVIGDGSCENTTVLLTDYGKTAEKYLIQMNNFYSHISIDRYVIMPNHIHILMQITEDQRIPSENTFGSSLNSAISRFVSTFKRFTNKEYGENIWQLRSNDHVVRDKDDYNTRLRYIYENPARWYFDDLYREQ